MLHLTAFETAALWGVLAIAVLGLCYAAYLRHLVMMEDMGTRKMQAVWRGIKDGADTYLSRQQRLILPMMVVLTFALFLSIYVVPPSVEAFQRFPGMSVGSIKIILGLGRAGAFVMGAVFSLLVGQLGMRTAVQGNIRVAAAARTSFDKALSIAYRSGTITGMLTDGLGLLGGVIIFMIFQKAAPDALLGFGFGGTLLALFMRVGGGIYTKAADVGADLVGKIEAGIPEDDPRNPAVIADLVGDNVGDCAGMAADIFESYEVTMVSGIILGLTLVALTGQIKWIIFPLLVRAIGVFSSIVGTYSVRGKPDDPRGNAAMIAINKGFYTSAGICVVAFALVAHFYMHEWRAFLSVGMGIILALVIDELTKYFTDPYHPPVREIAHSSTMGSATLLLSGLFVGFESTVWAVLVIAATIFSSVLIYHGQSVAFVLYGVAMTGIGMLTLTGNNVAMDSFGPIVDNANGIGEMAGLDPKARKIMANLDAVGNTTKAITKGVAIGSAVIAAVALFGSFLTDVSKAQAQLHMPQALRLLATGVRISNPKVFIGLLVGGALPWLFSALTINSVSRAAALIVSEVRRQFKIPGLLEGEVEPDYRQAVAICTLAAQKELVGLALLALLTPIIVGLILGVEGLGGFLAGAILSGQLLAVFMSTSGGAWDNAKKIVEDGFFGGKGSEAHKAAVVGDTVGDPLKDTAGPALNPMIKVINLVGLLAAPILIKYSHFSAGVAIVVVLSTVAVATAIWYSKRTGEKEFQQVEAFAAESQRRRSLVARGAPVTSKTSRKALLARLDRFNR
jgi:K(+)-stimulated pyrophosphate-energized sodium pump